MGYSVDVKHLEPILLAVWKTRARPAEFGARITGSPVWGYLRSHGIATPGHNVAIYHHPLGDDGTLLMEAGADVVTPFPEDGSVVVNSATPAGFAATTRHVGSYARLGPAHQAVVDWCKQNGWERTGVLWEIYGHWTGNEADAVTDVFHQVRAR